MKKTFIQCAKSITLGTFAALAVTVTSCNDELDVDNNASASASTELTSDDPFGCGCRLIATSTSEISNLRIPVNSNDIELSNTNSYFSYRIIQEDSKFFIVPAFNGGSNDAENDVLTLKKKDGSAEKSIMLTVTPEGLQTRSLCAEDGVNKVVVSKMVKGFIPGKIAPEAQVGENIFKEDRILAMEAEAEKANSHFLNIDTRVHSDYFYHKATTHNEIVQSNAKEAGFSLAVPISGFNIGFGAEGSKTTKSKKSQDVETALFGYKYRTASGCMNMDYLGTYIDNAVKTKKVKQDFIDKTVTAIMDKKQETDKDQVTKDVKQAIAMQYIIDATVNDVLNNSTSTAYKNYKNDKEGMKDLVSKYGMYVGIGCQVGGLAQSTLTKSTTSSEMSIEEAVKLTLEATSATSKKTTKTEKGTEETKDGSDVDVEKLISIVPVTTSAKAHYGEKSTYSEIKSAVDINFQCKTWGGNQTTDISEWKISNDCKNWEVISFAYQQDNATSKATATDNSNFIPLWKLCIDPARRAILRSIIEPDANGQIGYFTYSAPDPAKKTLVIADIKFKTFSKMEDVKPVYEYDSRPKDKKMHFYIPMRCNANYGLGSSAGDVLDFAKWQIIGEQQDYSKYISNHMVAMVAYEYVYDDDVKSFGDFTGITNVTIGDQPSGNQARSGCDTFDMTNNSKWQDRKGNHYLLVTYASDKTPMNERLKGVGFLYTNNDHNGDMKGKVFASSIGTDWDPNYASTKADFTTAWSGDFLNKNIGGDNHIYDAERYTFIIHADIITAKKVYPCGTTKDVPRDVKEEIKKAISKFN